MGSRTKNVLLAFWLGSMAVLGAALNVALPGSAEASGQAGSPTVRGAAPVVVSGGRISMAPASASASGYLPLVGGKLVVDAGFVVTAAQGIASSGTVSVSAGGFSARNATASFGLGTAGNEFVGYAGSTWTHAFGTLLVNAGVTETHSNTPTFAQGITMSGSGLNVTNAGGYLSWNATTAGGIIISNISAASAGATPATAAIRLYTDGALDSADWALHLGTAANAATLFRVSYAGMAAATGGIALPSDAAGAARTVTDGAGQTQWITAANAVGSQVNTTSMCTAALTSCSGILTIGAAGAVSMPDATNTGTCTLSAGSCTKTVNSGATCVCSDGHASGAAVALRCNLSGTTLTISDGVGVSTHIANYHCF